MCGAEASAAAQSGCGETREPEGHTDGAAEERQPGNQHRVHCAQKITPLQNNADFHTTYIFHDNQYNLYYSYH